MNNQTGVIKIQATMDDVTFYKRNGKYMVKKKSGVSKSRIMTSPKFALLRKHTADFTQAATGGKLIRNAFASLLHGVADINCVPRLTARVLEVIQSDSSHPVGQRLILSGNLDLLQDFAFNAASSLSNILTAPSTLTADASTGAASLQVPTFVPAKNLKFPKEATHFQVVLGSAFIDFDTKTFVSTFAETAQIPVDAAASGDLSLNCSLAVNGTKPMVVVIGVSFSQLISGVYEPLQNSNYLPLNIVEVV